MTRPRLPAEWERQEATLLCWPHNRDDWPGKMALIPHIYAEMIRWLAQDEKVHILAPHRASEVRARKILRDAAVAPHNVSFLPLPTNRSWIRDYGPLTVLNEKKRLFVKGRFNGWAKYRAYEKDDRVVEALGERYGMEVAPITSNGAAVVLEGGAIDVNGAGSLVTTEECLLDQRIQARNRGFDKRDYEKIFAEHFGATTTIWLGGGVAGDDTHGHVDDICRFVNRNTMVAVVEKNRRDQNYRPLHENRERLQSARLANGDHPDVVELPTPSPRHYRGQKLPASYANFYIANRVVLTPTFNDPHDRVALGILAELFPERKVVGINATDLIWGRGAIHCLTMQIPAGGAATPKGLCNVVASMAVAKSQEVSHYHAAISTYGLNRRGEEVAVTSLGVNAPRGKPALDPNGTFGRR